MQNRADYLGATFDCECGRRHAVPTERIEIGANLLPTLPQLLRDLRCTGRGYVIADRITWRVAGRRVAALGIPDLQSVVIPSDHPSADMATATSVAAQVGDADYLISCGSGTVTDLTKFAAHHHQIPFVAVATAPSMNGYTSGIVALTEDGLKKTIPTTPARALLGDLDILCEAPLPMIQAGLGDLVSKPVCNADWQLTHLLRGEAFCARPFAMIADLESIYLPQAGKIPQRDAQVIRALIEAIGYSGVSMVLAGSSAPASGGEHLISHSLDMQQGLHNAPHLDWHGTQVGVATLVTATLYQAWFAMNASDIDWPRAHAHWQPLEAHADRLRNTWGRAADAVIAAFAKKHPATLAAHQTEVERIRNDWERLHHATKPFLANIPAVRRALQDAGAKWRYTDLGISWERFRDTVLGARFIRERYSILDLLDSLGILPQVCDTHLRQ